MAKTTTIPITQALTSIAATLNKNTGASVITGADGALPSVTNLIPVATGGAEGSLIKSLWVTSTETVARILQLWIGASGQTTPFTAVRPFASVNIPIGSGWLSGTTAGVDLLANSVLIGLPFDAVGKPFIYLPPGQTIYAGTTVVLTTLLYISLNGVQEDF